MYMYIYCARSKQLLKHPKTNGTMYLEKKKNTTVHPGGGGVVSPYLVMPHNQGCRFSGPSTIERLVITQATNQQGFGCI